MVTRWPQGGRGGGRGATPLGGPGPTPRDVWILLGVVLFTFSLQFFAATRIISELLRLTPQVWRSGMVWQLLSYPFAGIGAPSFWFLLELFVLWWFASDVYRQLGRRNFWLLLLWTSGLAGVGALLVDAGARLLTGQGMGAALALMQGQHMLVTVIVAAFATMNRNATILLFFVLPIQARWFLGLEILFAFLGFLGTKDLAGFLGICLAVACAYSFLTPGGLRRWRRESWLRLQEWWTRRRLERMRKRRGFRIVEGQGKDDEWLH